MQPNEWVIQLAKAAENTKALHLNILDLTGLTRFTDYFLICSGTSDTQVRAIADNIQKKGKEIDFPPIGSEGFDKGEWVLIDFGSVVAHVFHENVRERYSLEKLWSDAVPLAKAGSR